MPQQDGTGPLAQGPMTGRGLGPCGAGAGISIRRGFGRGICRWFSPIASFSKQEEQKILEAEKQEIEKRLKELKTK